MKLLITGGNGFIGRNLVEHLGQQHEVFAPGRAELDLLDESAVCRYLRSHSFDVVVHAATVRANRKLGAPASLLHDNLRMFFNLERQHEAYGRMLFLSSGAVYDRRHAEPAIAENQFGRHIPADDYGFSKYVCGRTVEDSINLFELRLFGVFGPHEDWEIRFLSNACCRALWDRPIGIRQNVLFDYLDVADLAKIVEWFFTGEPRFSAYNVSRGQAVGLAALAESVVRASEKALPIVVKEPGMGAEYSGCNRRLMAEIPEFHFRDIDDSIRNLYQWYAERKDQIDPGGLISMLEIQDLSRERSDTPGERERTTREIQELLREGRDAACARERTTFDSQTAPYSQSLVLFGAGGIGRKTLRGLRQIGIEPLAFADNNPALWEKPMMGVPVMSPQIAAARYGKTAAFVVTIWTGEGWDRMGHRVKFLRDLGCERIANFGTLFWKYPDVFLPHYAVSPAHEVWDQADAVMEVAGLWSDDASRREYLSQIRWRLLFDFDGLADPVKHPTYFPDDLLKLREDEVFVDCGAYDGDTIASFVRESGGKFRTLTAFEPDPASFQKLERKVASMPQRDRITLHKAGTGAENCKVMFNADGSPAASMGSGTLEIDCVKLDDALNGDAPTFIKMDIEGAEPDALLGARQTIARHRPVLAICSYHRQDHVWRIPQLIHSFHPGYKFFLRPHLLEVWDLVCYAIPEERLL